MPRKRWTFLFREGRGHKYYRDKDGKVAVADNSGEYPEDTDDGILYLDTSRPILVWERGAADIPLLTPEGKQMVTPASLTEAARVRAAFSMDWIETGEWE